MSRIPRSVLLVLALTVALVGLGAYVALGLLGGDSDRDGRVPVPGAAELELPAGEVDLFYAEDVSLDDSESLVPPGDLRLRIAPVGGDPLEIRARGGQQISGGGGTATLIGSIDVAEAGPYEVATRSESARARSVPEVTLGESPFDLAGERLGNIVAVVLGPVGAAILVLAALVGIVALVRSRSTMRGPSLPPGANGSP